LPRLEVFVAAEFVGDPIVVLLSAVQIQLECHRVPTEQVYVVFARQGACVVTETRGGSLQGRRVIRGREVECEAFYAEENKEA
jgi:hypothetical protein